MAVSEFKAAVEKSLKIRTVRDLEMCVRGVRTMEEKGVLIAIREIGSVRDLEAALGKIAGSDRFMGSGCGTNCGVGGCGNSCSPHTLDARAVVIDELGRFKEWNATKMRMDEFRRRLREAMDVMKGLRMERVSKLTV